MKSEVNKRLNELRPIGWNFKHFSSHRRMPTGSVGFVDHVGNSEKTGHIVFIEDKISESDRLRKGQREYKESLMKSEKKNRMFKYYCLEESGLDSVIRELTNLIVYGDCR